MKNDQQRLMPSFKECEEHILGCIINNPGQLNEIIDIFDPKYFYVEEYKVLATIILELYNDNIQIDYINIYHKLQLDKKELIDKNEKNLELHTILSLNGYVLDKKKLFILIEKWMLREQIRIANTLSDNAFNNEDPFDNNDVAVSELENIDIRDKLKESFGNIVDKLFENIDSQHKSYLSCSNDDLFQIEPRQIILLAGTEGVGKTKFITYLMTELLTKNDIAVCWDTYEMPEDKLLMNIISCLTKIPYNIIKSKKFNELEKIEISKSKNIIRNFDIEFNTDPSMQVITSNFKRFCKKRKDKHCILVIDNIGSIEIPGTRSQTEIDDTMMKKMVQLRDITNGTVFLIHHLTKEVDDKDNLQFGFRPTKNHLRGSGRLKDYSNNVWLINYPSKYPSLVNQEKHRRTDHIFPDKTHYLESTWILECVKNRENVNWIIWNRVNFANNQFNKL